MIARNSVALLFAAFTFTLLLIACSDDVGDNGDDGWNVGEPNGDECPTEDDFTGHFQPTECMDGDPPVGACPEAEGYFSVYIEGCGCFCDYDSSGVEPKPEPELCPEDEGSDFTARLEPIECDPDEDVQCPEVEGKDHYKFEIENCGCYCGYDPIDPLICPDEDDGYHYVSDDPAECASILFDCPDGQDHFFDEDCGCGCVELGEPAECTAQDAAGDGACMMILGYAFNGRTCTELGGCDCVGDDCDEIFNSREACRDAYKPCLDNECEPMDAVGVDVQCPGHYGYAYHGEEEGCVGIGGCDCAGDDCEQLYSSKSECLTDHAHCADNGSGTDPVPGPGPTCSPWDVEAQGPCDMELGFGYDGDSCVSFSGCDCVGADCDRLTAEPEDCEKQIRDCDYSCGDPDGSVCDVYMSIDPTTCPDGSAYTVVNCEPMCVDPESCDPLMPDG